MRTPGTAWAFRPARGTVETDASSTIRPESHRGSDIADRAWHDSYVPVVFLITIAAVLVGIFFAAIGRGGELSYEHADHAPLDLGPVSAADVALLRPPTAMWGYNMQVTDEALDRIARAMRERDVTIAYLQEQLAILARNGSYAEPRGVHARQAAESPLAPEVPPFPEAGEISDAADAADAPEAPEALEYSEALESPEALECSDAPESPETPESPDMTGTAEVAQAPEAPQAPEFSDTQPVEALQPPRPPQTTLVLKASPAKAPPAPEPHEATQPSETLQDSAAHDATQPSEPLAPYETHGPQGAFNTHDWWAEQDRAAREEAARRQAAGPSGVAEDDSLAPAEEQGW